MTALAKRKQGVGAGPATPASSTEPTSRQRDAFRELRWLIWTYFILLIFEGALRKWLLPALANPLLIVRDPVLLALYGLAYSRRVFPVNTFTLAIGALGIVTFLAGLFGDYADIRVAAFGLRCNFLHLPLIYVMARVLTFEDVRRMGGVVLALALPMAALMVVQFQAPWDAWVNRGAGEDAWMIVSINGHIRPSGTFSFVSGIIFYYALVTVFLVYGLVQKGAYRLWLTVPAGVSLPVALAVSGSRSTVASAAIVLGAFLAALFCKPSLVLKSTKLLAIAFLAASLAGGSAIFKEGMEVFQERVEHASDVEGGALGFVQRFVYQFTHPFSFMFTVPLFGYGLGSGTNVGAKLLTGQIEFLLAEDEWERVICESGAFLGLLYLLLRVAIAANLGSAVWRAARHGHFLPLLLFGACVVPIVNGQFGQSTTLGFACLVGGLTAASLRVRQVVPGAASERIIPAKVRAHWAAIEARKRAARGLRGPRLRGSP